MIKVGLLAKLVATVALNGVFGSRVATVFTNKIL